MTIPGDVANRRRWLKYLTIPGAVATQVSVDALLEVATHAVEENKVFCLNLSAPFLIQFFQVRACR